MDLMTKFLRENAPGFEFDESCNMEAFAKGADIFLSSFENTLGLLFFDDEDDDGTAGDPAQKS
jgi:hypothetical protein